MTLDAPKFGLATAIVFAVAWVVGSVLVAVVPGGMMGVSDSMVTSAPSHGG